MHRVRRHRGDTGNSGGNLTISRPDPPRTQTNPQAVRRKNFTVRLRGLDPDEVRYFMAGLANDLEGLQTQVATLTLENDSLCGRALGASGRRDGSAHRPGR